MGGTREQGAIDWQSISVSVICILSSYVSHILPTLPALSDVDKVWTLVAEQLNLRRVLPLNPMISFASQSCLVLPDQQEVREEAATEQEKDQISKHHAMAGEELGRLLCNVDVGADDAIEIAPSNDESYGNTTFVDTFDVIGRPSDGIWDTGICPDVSKTTRTTWTWCKAHRFPSRPKTCLRTSHPPFDCPEAC